MKHILVILLLLQSYTNFAQHIYIPYRKGTLWGLADTTGKLVLQPKYHCIDYDEFTNYSEKDIYFFTVLDNRKGVLMNNKEIIAPAYGYIGQGPRYFFCYNETNGAKKIFLHTLTGKKLNETPYINSTIVYHKYDNSKFPMFIFQTADSSYSIAYLDSTGGKLVFLLQKAFKIIFEYDAVSVQIKKEVPLKQYDIVRRSAGDFKMVVQEQPMDMMAFETVQMPVADVAQEAYKSLSFIKGNDAWTSSGTRLDGSSILISKVNYDTIYGNSKDDYQDYNYTNTKGEKVRYRNFLFTIKNKEVGVVFPDGKQISNQYQTAEFTRFNASNNFIRQKEQICFKVSKDGKYGLVNQDDKILIPLLYDELTPDLIVSINKKYGVLNLNPETIIPVLYDTVFYYNSAYHTRLQNKYGMLAFNANDNNFINLPPLSSVPLNNFKRFRTNYPKYQPYIVFMHVGSNGKLIGYFDKKGFTYYSE